MSDSIWATILATAKIFDKDPDFALYDISYANAQLYSMAMPMVGDGDDDSKGESTFDESLDACNPDNFKDFNEEDFVR